MSERIQDEAALYPVLHGERVFAGAVWDIRREEFDYDGTPIRREFMAHTGAVAIAAIDEQDRILLIQQYRHSVRQRDWEIPAGLLDIAGEDPLLAAQRELAEEADLVAEHWEALAEFATSPGGSDEIVRVYLARGLSATPQSFERTEEEADIRTLWVDLDEAAAAVAEFRVRNAILQLAVYAARDARARGWTGFPPVNAPWPLERR